MKFNYINDAERTELIETNSNMGLVLVGDYNHEDANFLIFNTTAEVQKLISEKLEKELLGSLIPSDKEMLMAEVEIQTITILMEVGLI